MWFYRVCIRQRAHVGDSSYVAAAGAGDDIKTKR